MPDDTPFHLAVSMPALLRHARTTYGTAMRDALAHDGYDDVPANGMYVIGALARGKTPIGQIVRDLRITKQAAGQLVDALVLRGYLTRETDPDDRRRLRIALTERGAAAAAIQREAADAIDAVLVASFGDEKVANAREVLAGLIEMRMDEDAA